MPTEIQWTDEVWNPVRGCSRVSSGCGDSTGGGCYAERQAYRFSGPGMPYEGLVRMTPKGPRWTGKVVLVEEKLNEPLKWSKPRRIFVNSMSDLFHEALGDSEIMRVFNVMRQCPRHVFQVLTKRPERMRDFCQRLRFNGDGAGRLWLAENAAAGEGGYRLMGGNGATGMPWVWLGTSVEDQKTADERIPLLLQTPAAVRWISAEPLLGPVDLSAFMGVTPNITGEREQRYSMLDWIVVGGESGPKARPFDLTWGRSIVEQCKSAGVPVFVKQFGSSPVFHWTEEASAVGLTLGPNIGGQIYPVHLKDKKGGDINEWPNDLRVREFPEPKAASVTV